MPANCLHKNPLAHSGTSQWGRVLRALHPSFARVDERSAADLILFAKEYGRHLTYFNQLDEPEGDWQALMRMDLSVVLATLGSQRVADYFSFVRREIAWIGDRSHQDPGALQQHFSLLFAFAHSWLYELETQYRQLPDSWPLKGWLTDIIRSSLAVQRYRLLRYHQKAAAAGLITASLPPIDVPLPFAVQRMDSLAAALWSEAWQHEPDPGQPFDPELHGSGTALLIKNTASHNLFAGIFEAIFKQGAAISRRAAESLEQSLTAYPDHTPHYALFLTFVKLFRYAQDSLNSFTQRHLNLYYLDILRLRPLPALPDAAHLLLSLHKGTSRHLIAKGTRFKAGKDANGAALHYAVAKDTVIGTARVASLQSLLAQQKTGAASYQAVYAAPTANSADGRGAKIEGTDLSWLPFGPADAANVATYGCAIASHLLYLQEGERTITLEFECQSNLPAQPALFGTKPQVELTGTSGWEPAEVFAFEKDPAQPKKFRLRCRLDAKAASIVPFDGRIHDGAFTAEAPTIRIRFTSSATWNGGQLWSSILIRRVVLSTSVTGFKQLVVRNDLSVLDTSKPFQPFGAAPYAGSACIIGSKEIFQKQNAAVRLHFEWDKVPQPEGIISHMSFVRDGKAISDPIIKIVHEPFYNYQSYMLYAHVRHLKDGAWGSIASSKILFSAEEMMGEDFVKHFRESCTMKQDYYDRYLYATYTEEMIEQNPEPDISFTVWEASAPDYGPETGYSNASVDGFIKLELNRGLGHKDYIQRFSQLASLQEKPPPEPYTPQVKSLTADYTASITLDFNESSQLQFENKRWQFFSVHPFGSREEHKHVHPEARFSLAPAFQQEGQLLIGLDGALPDESLHLLFQVSEGSANPLRNKQEVVWNYLAANNHWKPFAKGQVSDETDGLLHSGIVSFALPADLAEAPALMGGAHRWLRASVVLNSDAISNIIAVHAQAIRVVWDNGGADALQFSQAAPAGTIAKTEIPDPAIKKITQPYDSFGGRLAENDQQFYLRSSERLRHRNRAITIWDYERLVLAEFPGIYKVKCLNHTRVRSDVQGAGAADNEQAPGCVVVVPVPDISGLASRNPLRPLTSLDTLARIESYLKNLTSGHVRLQVRNPVFDEVVIRCDVKFHGADPAFYHDVLLEDLQQFMCPWAYHAGQDIEFGGRISKSVLINFIEERPYVDYLTRFRLYARRNGVTGTVDQEEVAAGSSRAILVSAPKNLHTIEYLNVQC